MRTTPHHTADGIELQTWAWPGAKPEFLLVHGLASNARLWDGVAKGLHQLGNGIVSLDLRGHGLSAKPESGYDFTTMSADLAGLIEATMNPPVIAVGQSFGGNLVIELAARFPDLVSGLVCVDGGFIDLQSTWPYWDEALRSLTPPSLDHLGADLLGRRSQDLFPGWPEEGIAAQLANFEIHDNGEVTRRLALEHHLQILRAMWEQAPAAVALEVKAPVLVLVAENQETRHDAQVERFVAGLAESRVRRIRGHHDLHAEQPENVVRTIAESLGDGFLR